ncbi:hypothetical protein E4U21_006244 [Claviceps maximensis]|nr:hypothetical protein E4U21_006244 [Claviceps maximensis]
MVRYEGPQTAKEEDLCPELGGREHGYGELSTYCDETESGRMQCSAGPVCLVVFEIRPLASITGRCLEFTEYESALQHEHVAFQIPPPSTNFMECYSQASRQYPGMNNWASIRACLAIEIPASVRGWTAPQLKTAQFRCHRHPHRLTHALMFLARMFDLEGVHVQTKVRPARILQQPGDCQAPVQAPRMQARVLGQAAQRPRKSAMEKYHGNSFRCARISETERKSTRFTGRRTPLLDCSRSS